MCRYTAKILTMICRREKGDRGECYGIVFYSYHIYTDEENTVNTWMMTHLQAWGTMFQNPDGTPDMDKIRQKLENEKRILHL